MNFLHSAFSSSTSLRVFDADMRITISNKVKPGGIPLSSELNQAVEYGI